MQKSDDVLHGVVPANAMAPRSMKSVTLEFIRFVVVGALGFVIATIVLYSAMALGADFLQWICRCIFRNGNDMVAQSRPALVNRRNCC
jgi:hypothetical protein